MAENVQQLPQMHAFPRVAVFVDGFNFYFGLKDSKFERYLWLDIEALAKRLLKDGQTLVYVKYFTASITGPSDKRKRQINYLEAIQTHGQVSIVYGTYREKEIQCFHCKSIYKKHEEKKTDVAIATHLIMGAVKNEYDAAILISGDSDLVPPVEAIKNTFPDKRVFARFPPCRSSYELKAVCHSAYLIEERLLKQCLLPDKVVKPNGYELHRPTKWR